VWDKAVPYCQQAGVRAEARSAHYEAVAYFEQALVALAQLPEHRDTLEQAIDLRLDLRRALQPLGEEARIFDNLCAAEALAERLGDYQRLVRITGHLGIYFSAIGEHARAIAACQRALTMASANGTSDDQAAAQTRLGQAYYTGGDFRQALDVARQAMALLTGDSRYTNFGGVALPAVSSRSYMAGCLAELGDFVEGRGVIEEAVQIAEIAKQPFSIAGAPIIAGLLYCRQGDIRQTIPTLERGLSLCQSTNIPRLFPMAAALLSAAYALAGRAAEALPLLDQTLERVAAGRRVIFQGLVLTELSEALLLVGRVDEARALAGRLLEISRPLPGRGYQAHAYRLLGEVAARGAPPEAELADTHYRQALALADDLGMRPLQAHCHWGLGMLYAQMGRPEQARAALSAAIEFYRAMEMQLWLPEAEATLAQVR
jgi:tetratricopeptide (TPR) repeat protein